MNLHQERELTTWEFTLDGTTCYERNYVMGNAAWINLHHHHPCMIIYKKRPTKGIYGMKRCLREFTSDFGKSTSENTRQFVHPLCKVWFCYSACVYILKHSSLCKKNFFAFPDCEGREWKAFAVWRETNN